MASGWVTTSGADLKQWAEEVSGRRSSAVTAMLLLASQTLSQLWL